MDQNNNEMVVSEQGSGLKIINPTDGQTVKTVIGENALTISKILLSQIQKVQESPDYLPQAKEVRENVRELISLGKAEIDMYRIAAQVMLNKGKK